MAIIKKNPHLPDYFSEIGGVSLATRAAEIPCIVERYEQPEVLYFPDLKPRIDFDFWASLDAGQVPVLKKFMTQHAPGGTLLDAQAQEGRLVRAGLSGSTARKLVKEIISISAQVLPVYEKLFSRYRTVRGNVCWRMNETYAENLHVDTYRDELPNHFARMFINLDNQPRIWHTSWTAAEMIELARQRVPPQSFDNLSANDLWLAFNVSVFGKTSKEWWDDQPRHIAFFEPGDVWAVDSRQVAHQIFYGRRAVSIDFMVDPATMVDPEKHYLRMAEAGRAAGPLPA